MIKRKSKLKEKIQEERAKKEKDWNFYLHIWRKRKHDSEISGIWLGPEPLTTMFHHILEKNTHEEFRYLEENIILLLPIEHDQVHKTPEKYEVINKRREKLLKLWQEQVTQTQEE